MTDNPRPPWWTQEDEARATKGAAITAGTDFYGNNLQRLEDRKTEICIAVRRYLHGDTTEKRQEGYQDALQRLAAYKDYCYASGEAGRAYYDDLVAGADIYSDSAIQSFGYAVYLLTRKNIKG